MKMMTGREEMELDLRERLINLYEKLGEANLTRKFLENELHAAEINKVERTLRENRKAQAEKSFCPIHGEILGSVFNVPSKTPTTCFKCFQDKRETLIASENHDYLGWGLRGLFEQSQSDESSESTSTDDDNYVKTRLSAARHKMLRKLRRKKPEVFELNYQNMSVDEILKAEISDLELRNDIRKSKGIGEKVNDKKSTVSKLRPRVSKVSKEYDMYGGGNFDFSYEVKLKEKYSSAKFDFLTGVIHYYQKYLTNYPEERYPSVSELIIKTGQNICKDEDDVVARYYDVLYKKGGQKKVSDLPVSDNKDESEEPKDSSTEKSPQDNKHLKTLFLHQLSPADVNRARKTSVLDLSCRSFVDVPTGIWMLDADAPETQISGSRKGSGFVPPKRKKQPKPISHLNLNYNKLKKFCPKSNFYESLIQLCLAHNKIEHLSAEFGGFKHLQILDLENNLLTVLPDSFCNLTSLKELILRRNILTELPNNFGNLKKLRTIDLRWNKLTHIPDTFEDLSSLGNLSAAYNKLKSLPMDLSNLYNLIILDVSYNKISEMPLLTDMPKLLLVNAMGNLIKEFPNFSNCTTLCEIRLDGNRMKNIRTECLTNCPVVQLTVSHNKIGSIPNDFYLVETLVLLDLTHNRLSWVPWSLARLKYLSSLRIEENHVQNISKDVINSGSKEILNALLHNLLVYEGTDDTIVKAKKEIEVLYEKGPSPFSSPVTKPIVIDPKSMAKTRCFIRKRLALTNLPKDWIQLAIQHKVTVVDISKNKFRYVPAGLKLLSLSLMELVIRENAIKTIPDFIGRMPNLVVLDLSFNCLETLPLSLTASSIKKLSCRRNIFQSIPKVVYMIKTIEQLDFSENSIKEIDVDGLRNLRKLRQLNLSKNEIRMLPSSLGFFANLRQLDVTDNPFRRPGQHIIRGGTQVILDYLKRHPDKEID